MPLAERGALLNAYGHTVAFGRELCQEMANARAAHDARTMTYPPHRLAIAPMMDWTD